MEDHRAQDHLHPLCTQTLLNTLISGKVVKKWRQESCGQSTGNSETRGSHLPWEETTERCDLCVHRSRRDSQSILIFRLHGHKRKQQKMKGTICIDLRYAHTHYTVSTTSEQFVDDHDHRRRLRSEPETPYLHAVLITSYRVGEASNPGPDGQNKHYGVVDRPELTDEQLPIIALGNPAQERRTFERKDDALTAALSNPQCPFHQATSTLDIAPYDYVKGSKPTAPTAIDRMAFQTDLILSNIKITTLDNNIIPLNDIPGLVARQEHQTPINRHLASTKRWKATGKTRMLSPPATHTGHASAGVGFQHDNKFILTHMEQKHDAFKRAHDNGRVKHCLVVIHKTMSFPVYTAYGYTGGHHNSTAAINTSNIFQVIAE